MLKNHPSNLTEDMSLLNEVSLNIAQAVALSTIASGVNLENFPTTTLQDFHSVIIELLLRVQQLLQLNNEQ